MIAVSPSALDAPPRRPAAVSVTMAGALNQALGDAMADDDRVLVFGEDAQRAPGVSFESLMGFPTDSAMAGCLTRRSLNQEGIIGTAIGMAMNGLLPVVEMQFDAFAYPAFEQITSHLAKFRNRTRGAIGLPIVVRIPFGGGIGGVEHHSDSSEVYYTHTPGLRVLCPGTPTDAYRLLRQAIECPDPVIFLEPKRRYWSKEINTLETTTVETNGPAIDRAVIRRPGTDATLITYGGTVATALEAAEAATEEGWNLEVVEACGACRHSTMRRSVNP